MTMTVKVTLEHVTKHFGHPGRQPALSDVTLSISPGERVGFVGANGSGKTTLLRAMLGLVRVEGRIHVGGVDVTRYPELALQNVAYIPQIAPPLEASVSALVGATAAIRDVPEEATWASAERFGLSRDAVRAKRFRELSGGMKQKLLAAMALSAKAPVLVCDEPTANLDAEARAAFFEQLAERPKGSIVLLCSHRVEEVRALVDRVVELRDGHVQRDARVAEYLEAFAAVRIELSFAETSRALEARLAGLGFSACGPDRFAIQVAPSEKVPLLAKIMARHGAELADLTVTPIDEFVRPPKAPQSPRPVLRAVTS